MKKPNVIIVFGDQWRAQAMGYNGNNIVQTPVLDKLSEKSVNFANAIAGCPVCCPYRASLITGQYPQTHGVFVNDVPLSDDATSIAQAFAGAGYDTAYVGKWHLDGRGRINYIPPERRQGFDYWKVLECTHDYNDSIYYDNNCDEKKTWEGYDAIAQTKDFCEYIRDHASNEKPIFGILSWGPPHNPYESAPEEFKQMYKPEDIELRPNVPEEEKERARDEIAGYYAHCSALDNCMQKVLDTLRETGIEEDTILLFTSDHGDMIGSHGQQRKQRPWDESIRVPFLIHSPEKLGTEGKKLNAMIDAPDIMPTLLGLSGITVPKSVEGFDYSKYIIEGEDPSIPDSALIMCMHPFGEYIRKFGGKEYRGIRTERYTYAKDLEGPWILYDNESDPYQIENLLEKPGHEELLDKLEKQLENKLDSINDEFLHGDKYIEKWGYETYPNGTVPWDR